MTDPRNFDRRMDLDRRIGLERRSFGPRWAWAASAIVLALLLAFVLGAGGPNKSAKTGGEPSATTGLAPTPTLTNPPRLPQPDTPSGGQFSQ